MKGKRSSLVGLSFLAGALAAGLARRSMRHDPQGCERSHSPVEQTGLPQGHRVGRVSGRDDFSFLLAILAGVALAAGVVALQTVMVSVALTVDFFVLVVFWLASFVAVALVYLSVKYGAVFIEERIDATENIMLMLVTLAESAMFIAVTIGPGPLLAVHWFGSISAFGLLAGSTTAIVKRMLTRQVLRVPDEKTSRYADSLKADIVMAFMLAIGAAVYLFLSPHPSSLSMLIAGLVCLLFLIGGILNQRRTRLNVF